MSKGVFHPTFFGKGSIKSAQDLSDKLEYDSRLVKHVLAISTFAFPKDSTNNGPSQNKAIAFDPGIRTFCTGYDPDGIIMKLGESDM
jgi:hypothetical protein